VQGPRGKGILRDVPADLRGRETGRRPGSIRPLCGGARGVPPKEEIAAHRKALELAPEDPEALFWYGNALIGVDDDKALRLFDQAIAREPDNARDQVGRASALHNLERYSEALAAYALARRLCPSCLSADDQATEAKTKRLAEARGGDSRIIGPRTQPKTSISVTGGRDS